MKKHDLFELIQSLTPAEKRYFRMFASIQQGDKQYMILFDALEKQRVYDEKELKELLEKKKIKNSLTKIKGYLYNLILKSLRNLTNYRKNHSDFIDLEKDILTLYSKGLYQQCDSHIKKAKRIAKANEWFLQMIQLNFFESYIMFLKDRPLTLDDIELHFSSMLNKIKLLENEVKFKHLYKKMAFLVMQENITSNEKVKEEYDKILKDSLMQSEKEALSYYAKSYYYQCLLFYYYLHDKTLMYDFSLKHKSLMEEHPLIIKNHPANYALSLINHALAAFRLNKFKEVQHLLRRVYLIKQIPDYFKPQIELKTLGIDISVRIKLGDFVNARKIIEQKVKQMLRQYDFDYTGNTITLYHDIIIVYFGIGNYKESLHWCNRLLNETEIDSFKKFKTTAKVLTLLIHLELQNHRLLPSLISSARRYLIKNQCYTGFEQLLLRTLDKVVGSSLEDERRECYQDLRDKIDAFKDRSQEFSGIDLFDYKSWAQSKIENRSFAEIVQEKAGAYVD